MSQGIQPPYCTLTPTNHIAIDIFKGLWKFAFLSENIFLWTHFFDDQITDNPERYPHFDPKHNVHKELDGYRCTHYYRSYQFRNKQVPDMFSGGNKPFAFWLSKDDILGYLATLGFTDITIRGINLEHKAGPAFRFLATHPGRVNET